MLNHPLEFGLILFEGFSVVLLSEDKSFLLFVRIECLTLEIMLAVVRGSYVIIDEDISELEGYVLPGMFTYGINYLRTATGILKLVEVALSTTIVVILSEIKRIDVVESLFGSAVAAVILSFLILCMSVIIGEEADAMIHHQWLVLFLLAGLYLATSILTVLDFKHESNLLTAGICGIVVGILYIFDGVVCFNSI